jgi:hypothetical protein
MDPSDVKQIMEELTTKMMAMVDTHYGRVIAKLDARLGEVKACEGTTKVFLEKKGSAPEEPESVAEPKEVPESATEQETVQAAEDQTGELRLAVRRHRQRRKRAQENGGPQQKFAAFHGRVTCRAIPAVRKGHVRKGPGKKCHSGLRGQTKASRNGKRGRIVGWDQQPAVGYQSPLTQHTKDIVVRDTPEGRVCEKRRWTQPRCNSGIKDRGMKQWPHLGTGNTFIEALGQNFGLEIVKRTVGSSTILRSLSNWLLWKCRPPPKQKR